MDHQQERLDSLQESWVSIQKEEDRKKDLITELFKHLGDLNSELSQSKKELRDWKDVVELKRSQVEKLEGQVSALKKGNERHAFSMVLVDGDNMPFQDDLVRDGFAGGKRTASLLRLAVEEDLKIRNTNLPHHHQIVIRVFANLKGLSKKYREVLPDAVGFDEFVRGFNTLDAMCDYIDAGNGKECADEKIKGTFKFNLQDIHCGFIYFGGAADNGYARTLDPLSEDEAVRRRVVLLRGPPFAYELKQLAEKFETAQFEKVFRSAKLPASPPPSKRGAPVNQSNITPPGSPIPCVNLMDYASIVAKPPSSSGSPPPTPLSHATAGQTSLEVQLVDEAKTTTAAIPSSTAATTAAVAANLTPIILRNSLGQRIDSKLNYSQQEYVDLKDRKLCNNFHLIGRCHYFERHNKCHHEHGTRLPAHQLEALRAIARNAPCVNGLGCEDLDCVSGHHCPRTPCTLKEECWFTKEMHGVDQTPILK